MGRNFEADVSARPCARFLSRATRRAGTFLALALLLAAAAGPAPGWVAVLGGEGGISLYALEPDPAGGVLVGGQFGGAIDFDPGPGERILEAQTYRDSFVARLTRRGGLDWVVQFSATDLRDLAIDSAGNVFATGQFYGSIDFDPGPGELLLTSQSWDAFALSLDSRGRLRWAVGFGGPDPWDNGVGIAVAPNGNVAVTGEIHRIADLDPGPGVYEVRAGRTDPFLVLLDPAGGFLWGRSFGSYNVEESRDVEFLPNGDIVLLSDFFHEIDLLPEEPGGELVSHGGWDILVARFDPAGNLLWAGNMGGPRWENPRDVAVTPEGGILVSGTFPYTADVDPLEGVYYLDTGKNHWPGLSDAFVASLTGDGELLWAGHLGGPDGNGSAGDLVPVPGGGTVWASMVGNRGLVDLSPLGEGCWREDLSGRYLFLLGPDGRLQGELEIARVGASVQEVELDVRRNVLAAGVFQGTVRIPATGGRLYTSTGGQDLYVTSLPLGALHRIRDCSFGGPRKRGR